VTPVPTLPSAVDAVRTRLAATLGQLSAPQRVLPDFLIIGAQRAGTATLYYNLVRHPSVLPALRKEVHFFDLEYWRGPRWYRGYFPTRRLMEGRRRRNGVALTGEATPYYLFHPAVPSRVAAVLPQARFVVLLRDPVARAYSHYQREVRKGREPLSFADALAQEPSRLAGEAARLVADPRYHSERFQRFSYRTRGVYAPQLRAWLAAFPRERFLVLESEALFADPVRAFGEVAAFLGLPPWRPSGVTPYNTERYATLDPALRAELEDFYRPHNMELETLLGRPPSWVSR
jgi:hypothetical protein